MAFIKWTPELSVGIPDIDQQHRRLLEIMSRLHDVILDGGAPKDVSRALEEVVAYAQHHFSFEERMLGGSQYPFLEEHRRKHRAMFAEIEVYQERATDDPAALDLTLMNFLRGWILRHILHTDKRYTPYLTAPVGAELSGARL